MVSSKATIAISFLRIINDPFPLVSLTAKFTVLILEILDYFLLKSNLSFINGLASIEITLPFGEAKASG